MLSKQFILLFLASIFLLGLIDAKKSASEDPAEDGDEEISGKKSKKGKKKAATIDTSELEGVWESTFYFNHTESRVVARTCQKEGVSHGPSPAPHGPKAPAAIPCTTVTDAGPSRN
ncbi:hypothetical protein DSO57_1001708 [Entomophthora muscae]|uniref:Uncharacterized protein n=1 Tax=Entomophthora muscae TaxID=34485 RepID=A0ACC2SLR9_9FUNG|nr:hypothetical protein DSO57_1001708 [Entomophthora muscae]